MRYQIAIATIAATFALCATANEIVIENANVRLTLGTDGCAQSLVAKSTGEECLMPGVRIPFARIRQDRPYDNEMHLIHPAKPMFFAANRMSRSGDTLEIGFTHEYHVLKLRIAATDDYIAFIPEGTDYRITDDFGDKRRTEIDGIEFLRLPVKARAHFGACANVAWDESTAVAAMGLAPEVRIDGEMPEGLKGWRRFGAATENALGLFGRGAALVAGAKAKWLDHVDAMERDFGLPRGVKNRRDPIMSASYVFISSGAGLTLDSVDEHIALMKKGGFRVGMISYTAFASSCGHFTWRKTFPNGMADLKKIQDMID